MAAADMPVISDLLVRKEVLCLEAIRPLMPRLMADPENLEPRGENNFSHVSMKNVAYTAGRLYVLDHPDNPYRGDEEILAMCLELADAWCTRYEACRRAGAPMDTTEWPCYIMTQLIQMLPPEKIGPERTSRWKENLEIWCDMMVPKPFFFTSPNHEAWKCMVLWTAGEVLGRPDYQEAAAYQQRQQINYQTPDGFWAEGRHHGPSLKYNFMQLQAMSRLAELSGDSDIRASAVKLADFMAEFSFPDGTTIGGLDGRQSYTLGPWLAVAPGQDLTPAIREMTRRSVATQHRYGGFTDAKYVGSSYWYTTYGVVMLTDGSRFFEEVDEPAISLPLDVGGGVVERHSAELEGGAIRRGGFVAALSGIVSDIPKETGTDRYRLQRQNRIDLWHERTGLIIGGGHGVARQNPPYANVIMETGFAGTTDFGMIDEDHWGKQMAYFSPRAARVVFDGGSARLETHFSHGSVIFRIEFPSADEAEIHYDYSAHSVRRLCIQVVPVFFRDSKMRVDGREVDPYEPAVLPVKSAVEVTNTILGGTYRIERASGDGEARLRTPLDPLRTYGDLYEGEIFDSFYKQSLLSIQLDDPPKEGSGVLKVVVN